MESHTTSVVSDKGSPSPPTSPVKDNDGDDDLSEEDKKRRRAANEAIALIDATVDGIADLHTHLNDNSK